MDTSFSFRMYFNYIVESPKSLTIVASMDGQGFTRSRYKFVTSFLWQILDPSLVTSVNEWQRVLWWVCLP